MNDGAVVAIDKKVDVLMAWAVAIANARHGFRCQCQRANSNRLTGGNFFFFFFIVALVVAVVSRLHAIPVRVLVSQVL